MNKYEIKWNKQLLISLSKVIEDTSLEYKAVTNGIKTIDFLVQENEKLKERIAYLERSNNRRETTILEQKEEINDLEDKVDKAVKYKEKQKEVIDMFLDTVDKNKMLLNNPDLLDLFLKIKGVSEC